MRPRRLVLTTCLLLAPACAHSNEAQEGPAFVQASQTQTSQTGAPEASSDHPASETATKPKAKFCTSPEHRAFDFWSGHFEVRVASGQLAGHNHIELAHGGCALIEHWRSADGGGGTSLNYYDPGKKVWVQRWIDSHGSVIELEGNLVDDAMILVGTYTQADGSVQSMRGTWTPLPDGRVRQFFEASPLKASGDDKTWTTWFEGFYSRVEGE